MQTLILTVGGMTCGGCSASIERVLNALAGVSRAQADWAAATAEVEFDPAQVSAEDLIAAVEDAGFDAQVRQNG